MANGPDLFAAAGERLAIASGRPLSQELAELKGAPNAAALPAEGLFAKDAQVCARCGARFIAAPRADSTCNLCRRNLPVRPCLECGRPCSAGCGLCSPSCATRRFGD
jgi:hypothetical protein